mmetsp:Transcript_23304/g.48402  ORF Transcript_23304/g.48402 Transcript_23304/m.48402 type:complete len:195 (-) Transcript_23304:23-607(-)
MDEFALGLKTVRFVTGNRKKVEEVEAMMEGLDGVEFDSIDIEGLPEVQGADALEIAREKCAMAWERAGGGAVMVEDTSLCFNAMGGMPGPYIKWFLGKLGHEGLNKMLEGFSDKTACAQTVVAFCEEEGKVELFEGRTEGKIVPARGSTAFGWDAIFEVGGKTYGEMSREEKGAVSHRGKAMLSFRDFLRKTCE